jgi:hypothetical protein
VKHLLFIFLSVVLASLISACGSQPAQMVYQVPKSTTSQQCFITESDSQIWLEQEEEWNALPIAAREQLKIAQIDFSKESILIVSAGKKPSAGYRFELTNWLLEQDHWQVTRIAYQPQAGSMQAQVITSPCLLIKIPKTIKSFTLNDEKGQTLGRWPY